MAVYGLSRDRSGAHSCKVLLVDIQDVVPELAGTGRDIDGADQAANFGGRQIAHEQPDRGGEEITGNGLDGEEVEDGWFALDHIFKTLLVKFLSVQGVQEQFAETELEGDSHAYGGPRFFPPRKGESHPHRHIADVRWGWPGSAPKPFICGMAN